MSAKRSYALGPLTVLELSPPDEIRVAAELGYDFVGLRLLPSAPGGPAYPLMDNPAMLRETLDLIQSTGVKVFDLEMIRINAEFSCEPFMRFMEIGAELGAQCILVAGDDPDHSRFTDNFAKLCDSALNYGLKPNLEFMPWTDVKDLRTAIDLVSAANRENAGVLIDALHFDRSNSNPADIKTLPAKWLHYAQICDGPAERPTTDEALIHAARIERLMPGTGGMPLTAIFAQLPANLPICVEVPNPHIPDPKERARIGLETARAWFAEHIDR